ncbi:MAG TPA: endonuclease III [Gemmatimonadaceae bacterium]|nr:endonuclease III [Gemmatimonadaceae bacterium]
MKTAASTLQPVTGTRKRPFDLPVMFRRLRSAVRAHANAAMFQLAADGYRSLFEQLVACIISIRTLDEVSLPTAKRLLDRARTPDEMARLSASQIDSLIRGSSFHEPKARQIRAIAQRTVTELGGELPCDADVLMSFAGVGPKCANLALGIACGQTRISVDVHVHRVTNRWGYVSEPTPERTMLALEAKLPRRYWVEINRLLVPFGKHVCTGRAPKCSTCPVLAFCRQVGVTAHR